MIDIATLDHIRRSCDIFHKRYSSPVGDLYILGNGFSLKALIFRNSYPAGNDIAAIFPVGSHDIFTEVIHILDYYFHGIKTGKKTALRISIRNGLLDLTIHGMTVKLDLKWFTLKEMRVYSELLKIPSGSTISYGDLARRSGIPGGARFVGTTMAKNRFPIIIPCHRVIKSDESIGNYSGGVNIKKHLLDFEQN